MQDNGEAQNLSNCYLYLVAMSISSLAVNTGLVSFKFCASYTKGGQDWLPSNAIELPMC